MERKHREVPDLALKAMAEEVDAEIRTRQAILQMKIKIAWQMKEAVDAGLLTDWDLSVLTAQYRAFLEENNLKGNTP